MGIKANERERGHRILPESVVLLARSTFVCPFPSEGVLLIYILSISVLPHNICTVGVGGFSFSLSFYTLLPLCAGFGTFVGISLYV